jgi:hypothetical protein
MGTIIPHDLHTILHAIVPDGRHTLFCCCFLRVHSHVPAAILLPGCYTKLLVACSPVRGCRDLLLKYCTRMKRGA